MPFVVHVFGAIVVALRGGRLVLTLFGRGREVVVLRLLGVVLPGRRGLSAGLFIVGRRDRPSAQRSGTWGVVRASLRFRALGPARRLLGVTGSVAVAPIASGTMASATASPAAARGSRVLLGTASRSR
jgi:hypothetical protein